LNGNATTNIITKGLTEVANFEIQSEDEEEEDDYGEEDMRRAKKARKAGKVKRKNNVSPLTKALNPGTREGRMILK
jgi:hypothetical protein